MPSLNHIVRGQAVIGNKEKADDQIGHKIHDDKNLSGMPKSPLISDSGNGCLHDSCTSMMACLFYSISFEVIVNGMKKRPELFGLSLSGLSAGKV